MITHKVEIWIALQNIQAILITLKLEFMKYLRY